MSPRKAARIFSVQRANDNRVFMSLADIPASPAVGPSKLNVSMEWIEPLFHDQGAELERESQTRNIIS